MNWIRNRLGQRTTIASHRIVRHQEVNEDRFIAMMDQSVMPSVPINLNRATNIIAQELVQDKSVPGRDAYLWQIYWNGIENNDLVQRWNEEIVENVRTQIAEIGCYDALTVCTLETRLTASLS